MSEVTERRQVLEMLNEGQIGPEDAERLLERLAEAGRDDPVAPRGRKARGMQLHVVARSEDGDEIDVRIPLHLLATGVAVEKLLPEAAREVIEETGIELSELSNLRGDVLVEAIRDLAAYHGFTLSRPAMTSVL